MEQVRNARQVMHFYLFLSLAQIHFTSSQRQCPYTIFQSLTYQTSVHIFYISESQLPDRVHIFYISKSQLPDSVHIFYISESQLPDSVHIFYLSESQLPDSVRIFHISESMLPDTSIPPPMFGQGLQPPVSQTLVPIPGAPIIPPVIVQFSGKKFSFFTIKIQLCVGVIMGSESSDW